MNYSRNALDLIKQFEDNVGWTNNGVCSRLVAYPDPATGETPYTIGWGTTSGVSKGMVITPKQADDFLMRDLDLLMPQMEKVITAEINQNQTDALVDFAYNEGIGNLSRSTLLKYLNLGDFVNAAAQFPKWIYAGKPARPMPGLVKRRYAEMKLFQS